MITKKENINNQKIENEKIETSTTTEHKESKIEIKKLVDTIFQGYGANANDQLKENTNALIGKYLRQVTDEHECIKNYNMLILFDSSAMVKSDADNIYNSITSFKEKKPLLLILYSNGGIVGSSRSARDCLCWIRMKFSRHSGLVAIHLRHID